MTRVLVVDHAHSVACGIHDIGLRIADCLKRSTVLDVTHLDIADANGWRSALAIVEPDVVIVNYRPDLMPWVPGALAGTKAPVFAVLHQYEEATADARAMAILSDGFDWVLALDPLLHPTVSRLHAVGRPIPETVEHHDEVTRSDTRIGSFGFAFPHKGFPAVAGEIAAQIHHPATYNLHMPEAFFNGAQGAPLYTDGILAACSNAFAGRPDLWVHHTAEHLAERELVARLSANDVNCLLYHPGQPDAGLSSALDYLIAARRPMLLSEASMFRHGWMGPNDRHHAEATIGASVLATQGYAEWPRVHLRQVLDNYDVFQTLADELYAWHHGRLVADIERIVAEL